MATKQFTITEARTEDVGALVKFQIDMALETERLTLDEPTVARGVKAVIEDSAKGLYIVARDVDGQPIASLMVTKEWSDWNCLWYWWIQSVFVVSEYRGMGIFKAMYGEVMRRAKEEGTSHVRLYVDRTNRKAQTAYSKLGMHESHYLMFETTC